MTSIEIVTTVKVVGYSELTIDDRRLVDAARESIFKAYAPYSRFRVGAAIALTNGEIVTGSNQENIAYPSGLCAERVACFYAHSQYPEARFNTIAIAACDVNGSELQLPISPCGSCRQALLEYEAELSFSPPDARALRACAIIFFSSNLWYPLASHMYFS